MKQTLNKDTFRFLFNQIRPDNFTYEGQGILFDWFEQLEDDLGEQIEFDPIAICCDFSECSLREFMDCFPVSDEEFDFTQDDWGDMKKVVQDYVESHGVWYEFLHDDKQIIFQNF
jgi:hypothetical protein